VTKTVRGDDRLDDNTAANLKQRTNHWSYKIKANVGDGLILHLATRDPAVAKAFNNYCPQPIDR
ncbi:MAG: hypothetical protein ACK53L_25655, partial [Pirellulaceae bacterium]